METFLRVGLVIVAIAAMVGCKSTVNTVEPAEPQAEPEVVQDKRVITDSSLERKAMVISVRETVVGNGLLKVQAEVLNQTKKRRRVNYRFDWIDDAGMEIILEIQ